MELNCDTREYMFTQKQAIIVEWRKKIRQDIQKNKRKKSTKWQDSPRYKFMLINLQWLMDCLNGQGAQMKYNWRIGKKQVWRRDMQILVELFKQPSTIKIFLSSLSATQGTVSIGEDCNHQMNK